MQPSEHYLVITALGKDRPGIINTITHEVSRSGCNIEDSRFALLGENFTFIMLLSGSWNAITQIELILPKLGVGLDLLIVMKRTPHIDRAPMATMLRMQVEVADSPGLINQFTARLDPTVTNIAELVSKTSFDKQSGQATLHIQMSIQATLNANPTIIKQGLCELCQALNAKYTIDIIDYSILKHDETHGEI